MQCTISRHIGFNFVKFDVIVNKQHGVHTPQSIIEVATQKLFKYAQEMARICLTNLADHGH